MSPDLQRLIQDLKATRDETLKYFTLSETDLARTYAPGKWSIRFILHHIADSETVFNDRIRRALSDSRPVVWVCEQDAWARGLDYAQLPIDLSARVFESVRNAIIYLARAHYEKNGHREFVHSVTGLRTVKDELEDVASHNAHHLQQIRTALADRG